MCYQDVKMGLRRQSRNTALSVGVNQLRGDGGRVGIMLSIVATTVSPASCFLRIPGTGNAPIIAVSELNPNAEMWLERHGNIIQQQLEINNGGNATVTEIIDRTLDQEP